MCLPTKYYCSIIVVVVVLIVVVVVVASGDESLSCEKNYIAVGTAHINGSTQRNETCPASISMLLDCNNTNTTPLGVESSQPVALLVRV